MGEVGPAFGGDEPRGRQPPPRAPDGLRGPAVPALSELRNTASLAEEPTINKPVWFQAEAAGSPPPVPAASPAVG